MSRLQPPRATRVPRLPLGSRGVVLWPTSHIAHGFATDVVWVLCGVDVCVCAGCPTFGGGGCPTFGGGEVSTFGGGGGGVWVNIVVVLVEEVRWRESWI